MLASRLSGVVVLLGALVSGCWSYTTVETPARSEPGGLGYGTLAQVRGRFLVFAVQETSTYFTGVAGASGEAGIRFADGAPLLDGVWRVRPPGWTHTSLAMQFCRGVRGAADCRDVAFERPDGVSDRGYLSIIDPVNRGHQLRIEQTSVADAQGAVMTVTDASGSIAISDHEDPVEPSLGVWAAPAMGTLFHCAVEASGPRCRPAMLDGRPLPHHRTLAVASVARAGGRAHVVWEQPMLSPPVRCEVSATSPTPRCRAATLRGGTAR